MKTSNLFLGLLTGLVLNCSSDQPKRTSNLESRLIIRFNFDASQQRLNSLGQPATIPNGNATQTPNISRMSAHYLEFAPDANTPLGQGAIVYEGSETDIGGSKAIDFENAFLAGDDAVFLNLPLSALRPGSYKWVRVSIAFQEGDILLLHNGNQITGRFASFLGYNTYITTFDLNDKPFEINENKTQGFWAFEASDLTVQGQAPEGLTTVPNPLFESSPIPEGSCVLTGAFDTPFAITGDETEDITITLSFSVNNSFEWAEINADGIYEPSAGEEVVDMGLRGLILNWTY